MKVLVITGSPHRDGASALLADAFIKGASAAGHEIFRFDAGLKTVHSCTACEQCHKTGKGCVFRDDMEELNPHLLKSDAVVFVSPIYYYDMTPQIRAVIGRFYENNKAMHRKRSAALLLVCGDPDMESVQGSICNYHALVHRLQWHDAGVIPALGCVTAEDIRKSEYLSGAEKLGQSIESL